MADLDKLARTVVEQVIGEGKVELLDDLVTADFIEHEGPPDVPRGPDAIRGFVTMFRTGFPDLKTKVIATAVSGDEVWIQSSATGTHKGEFNGIPPTGKKIDIVMFDRVRTEDGKAAEHWGLGDYMALMTQLGVIPEPG